MSSRGLCFRARGARNGPYGIRTARFSGSVHTRCTHADVGSGNPRQAEPGATSLLSESCLTALRGCMSSPPASRMACPAVPRRRWFTNRRAPIVSLRVRLREPARRHAFPSTLEGSLQRDQPPDASSPPGNGRSIRKESSVLDTDAGVPFIVPKLHSRSRASRRIGIAVPANAISAVSTARRRSDVKTTQIPSARRRSPSSAARRLPSRMRPGSQPVAIPRSLSTESECVS